MVLFICVVSSIWFTFQCGFFFCHLLWGVRGIEVEKKKDERYIRGLVPVSNITCLRYRDIWVCRLDEERLSAAHRRSHVRT
jgi:hypothetical protein